LVGINSFFALKRPWSNRNRDKAICEPKAPGIATKFTKDLAKWIVAWMSAKSGPPLKKVQEL
jgi:hypothetical protein